MKKNAIVFLILFALSGASTTAQDVTVSLRVHSTVITRVEDAFTSEGEKPQAQSPTSFHYVIPRVETRYGIDTGVALVNGSAETSIVFLQYVTTSGVRPIPTVGLGSQPAFTGVFKSEGRSLHPKESWSFNASEHLDGFVGSLHVNSSGRLGGVAILYGRGFQFAYPLQRVD